MPVMLVTNVHPGVIIKPNRPLGVKRIVILLNIFFVSCIFDSRECCGIVLERHTKQRSRAQFMRVC